MREQEDDSIPLQPLNDVIRKFKRRREIIDWLMIISMPSALIGIAFYAVFALTSYSLVSIATFILLVISAIATYLAILYIPGTLTDVIRSLEYTIRGISFAITPPVGKTPLERISSQLCRTDERIKNVVKRNPDAVKLNANINGKSGKEHSFDIFIQSRTKHIFGNIGTLVFIRRFDELEPISIEKIKSFRSDVYDCVSNTGKRCPNRVLAVSTSGFDDSVFEYVRSKEGSFAPIFGSFRCRIELIQERIDGRFDILTM